MSLSGQLSDLHLSELIEFFCNQRKTGRLKVDYALAPGVFFINEGELTDAKVGALNGKDAVFFALTLPSAAFDFSTGMQSQRRTINETWASVVLEGLRRIDEGAMPEFDVFGGGDESDAAALEQLDFMEEEKGRAATRQASAQKSDEPKVSVASGDAGAVEAETRRAVAQDVDARSDKSSEEASRVAALSLTVDASRGAGRSKALVAGVIAALVLVCAVAAIPVSRHFSHANSSPTLNTQPATSATSAASTDAATDKTTNNSPSDATSANASASPDAVAAEEAARREQQQREARDRARKQREEAAKNEEAKNAAQDQSLAPVAKPATPVPAGAKAVRVQIVYDEAGRVTQASAIGTSPGAEAYAATAIRIARGRHFTPGKAGATVVTIPIN
jgi:hypothetical protein